MSSETISSGTRVTILWSAVAAALVSDIGSCFAIHLFDGDEVQGYLVVTLLGYLAGQIGLLAIWSALANQPAVIRIPFTFFLTIIFCNVVLISANNSRDPEHWQAMLMLNGAVLFVFVVSQIPLWITRLVFRRLISSATSAKAEPLFGHVSIRHFLIVTALIASVFALGRFVDIESEELGGLAWGILSFIAFFGALWCTGFVAVLAIPSVLFTLCNRFLPRLIGGAVITFAVICGGAAALVRYHMEDESVVAGFLLFGVSTAATMLAGLFLLRIVGDRMVTVDREGNLIRLADEP